MNKKPLEEKHKLSHNVPVPIEILDQEINMPHKPGIYHYHDYLELIYCTEGQLEIKTFNKSILLSANDMLLITSGEPHETTSLTPVSRHFCIKFLKELLIPFYDKDIIHYIRLAAALSKIDSFAYITEEKVLSSKDNIKNLFAEAARCYLADGATDSLTVYANILNIVSFVLSSINQGLTDTLDARLIKSKQDIIEKINTFMESNYQDATLAALARECSVNYSYLSTLFKELYGESFKSYLTKLRINKSVALLCESDMDISTIAQTVGFSTASHYIKMFKQQKNISPGKFRTVLSSKRK